MLDKLAVVIGIVSEAKFATKRQAFVFMLLLFSGSKAAISLISISFNFSSRSLPRVT